MRFYSLTLAAAFCYLAASSETDAPAELDMSPNISPPLDADRLMTPKEAAKVLGTSISTLARKRSGSVDGTPVLPFLKMGKRTVRYRLSDVRSYLDACTKA